jgi:D-serine deaminase-like pyridoxal phosphate-dependent protein
VVGEADLQQRDSAGQAPEVAEQLLLLPAKVEEVTAQIPHLAVKAAARPLQLTVKTEEAMA